MADSNEPVNRRAPVRKRLPRAADWKLKVEVGRARFVISSWRVRRKERISWRGAGEIEVQRACRASTISSHSIRASNGSEERR